MKNLFILFFYVFYGTNVFSQTYPTAFDLSTGNYVFNGFSSGTTTTYPASMQGWVFAGEPQSAITTDPLANRVLAQSSAAFTTGSIKNEENLGISFLNSSTNHIGAVVLCLNTLDRNQIQVSWTAAEMGNPNPNGDRSNALVLQYKIGNTETWTTIDNTTYITNLSQSLGVTPLQNFSIMLPEELSNKPMIFIRWLYYLNGGSGSRDRIRLDDITVSSQPLLKVQKIEKPHIEILIANKVLTCKALSSYITEITIYNIHGKELLAYKDVKSSDMQFSLDFLTNQLVVVTLKDAFGNMHYFKRLIQ